jgi:hypothetical protein
VLSIQQRIFRSWVAKILNLLRRSYPSHLKLFGEGLVGRCSFGERAMADLAPVNTFLRTVPDTLLGPMPWRLPPLRSLFALFMLAETDLLDQCGTLAEHVL